ncbi:MAG: DoxX family protein, partial [Planctomycetia bacterium]
MEQMASMAQGLVSLLARLMIAAIFLASAIGNKIPQFQATANYMQTEGVPNPKLALFGAIGLLLLGGVSVVAGAWTRIGALF